MLVRATFKLIKERDEWFWLTTLDIVYWDNSDSHNRKTNCHFADLIQKEKLILQNFLKSTKIESKKIGKKRKFGQK